MNFGEPKAPASGQYPTQNPNPSGTTVWGSNFLALFDKYQPPATTPSQHNPPGKGIIDLQDFFWKGPAQKIPGPMSRQPHKTPPKVIREHDIITTARNRQTPVNLR
jgi:hypothetical protein